MQAPPSCNRRAPIYAINVFPVLPRPRHRKPPLQPSPVHAQLLMPDTFTVKLNRIHLRLLEEQRHHINGLEHELASCRQHMWAQATQLHNQAAQIAVMQQQLTDMQEGSTGPAVMQRLAALEQHWQHAEAHSALTVGAQPSVGCQGDLSARVADLEQHLGLFSDALDHMHAMSDLGVQIRTTADETIAAVRHDADEIRKILEEVRGCKQVQNSTAAIDAETPTSDTASDTTSSTVSYPASNPHSDTASYPASDPCGNTASCGDNGTASDTGSDTGSGTGSNLVSDTASDTGRDRFACGIAPSVYYDHTRFLEMRKVTGGKCWRDFE